MSSLLTRGPRPVAQGAAPTLERAVVSGSGSGSSGRVVPGGVPPLPGPRAGAPVVALHGATVVALWASAAVSLSSGTGLPPLLAAALTAAAVLVLGDQALAVSRVTVPDALVRAVLSVGAGLTSLLLTGLALNTLGPLLGVPAPLRAVPVAAAITVVSLALHLGSPRAATPRRAPALPAPRALVSLAGLALLPVLAASGAVALGNGRSSAVAVTTLVAVIVVLGVVALRRHQPPRAGVAAAVYAAALALLLMTSLRGPSITGHDIQIEHLLATGTAAAGHWAPAADVFGDYRACLSVTVLPAMLSALFGTSTSAVLEVTAPVLFAACPVMVLLIAERVAGLRLAVVATTVFVSFPTFFTDMTMMVRQEIAYLVVASLVLVVATRADEGPAPAGARLAGLQRRKVLLVVLGVGAVLSHYSTTYLLVAQLLMVVAAGLVLAAARRLGASRTPAPARQPGPDARPRPHSRQRLLTVPVVLAIAVTAYVWAGPVTGTGSSFVGVAKDSLAVLRGVSQGPGGSSDLSVSLLGGGRLPTPQERLDGYATSLVNGAAPAERAQVAALLARYPAIATPLERAAPTALGTEMQRLGLSPFAGTAAVRGGSAAALQLLVGLGVLLVLWRGLRGRYDLELALMAGGAVALLGAFLVMPLLSNAYGLLRAFQQGLVVLAVPAVLALDGVARAPGRLVTALRRAGRRLVRRGAPSPGARGATTAAADREASRVPRLAMVAVLAFTASSTGLLALATGGYYPQLHLAAAGTYYDDYYLPDSDAAMMRWTAEQPRVARDGGRAVQADQWTGSRFSSQTGIVPARGVLPPQLRGSSFVIMGRSNVVDRRASDGLVNQPVPFTFPLEYLASTKNRVYDDGTAQVWR